MTKFHPIQTHNIALNKFVPEAVALAAYEVYSHVYAPQPAMIDLEGRNCRGGFGAGELIAFLYARSFPKDQWRARFEEACKTPDRRT